MVSLVFVFDASPLDRSPPTPPPPTPPPTPMQGVDRIIVVLAPGGRRLEVRQYGVALKKSGGRVPRVETVEVGPAWTATVTRHRAAPPDLERAAHKKVEGVDKKKVRERGRGGGKGKHSPRRALTKQKTFPFPFLTPLV